MDSWSDKDGLFKKSKTMSVKEKKAVVLTVGVCVEEIRMVLAMLSVNPPLNTLHFQGQMNRNRI